MFKRPKKLPEPPKSPSFSQIFDDLDTFKEDAHEFEKNR